MKRLVAVAQLALCFVFVFCNSGDGQTRPAELVGQWEHESGDTDEKPEKLELFKDGTGVVDGGTVSWKVENKRLVILSSLRGMACNYKVSGYELALAYDDGTSAIFVKKGKPDAKFVKKGKSDAKSAFERGKIEYDDSDGDKDKAMANFNEAIQMNPNFAEAYFYRGLIYEDKKDYDKAIAEYTQAIKVNPNVLESYIARALVYQERKDYDKEIADYTEVIKRDPNRLYEKYMQSDTSVLGYTFGAYHFLRGSVYLEKKEYDKAIADFNEEIRCQISFGLGNAWAAYTERGRVYLEKKEYDKAIADFNEAIRMNPKFDPVYRYRGDAYLEKKEYDKAVADFEKALQIVYLSGIEKSELKEKLEKAKKLKGELNIADPKQPTGKALTGGRSRASIQRGVMQNINSINYAYNVRKREKPDLAGKITVKFSIDEFGKVISAQLVESTINDSEIENTVVTRVKSWVFEKIDKTGDVSEFTYPFVFGDSIRRPLPPKSRN